VTAVIHTAVELRHLALADALRPRYHFTSPGGWLNDPNGVCQRDGVYHLFYQYNPYSAAHHRIHWGHATSTDLVRWVDQPIALRPEGGPDSDGCWSGVLVDDDGTPVIVYSGNEGDEQTACLAYGDDTLIHWRKEPGNPVVRRPEGADLMAFRDHCVWREGGAWRQLIGSGIRGMGGTAYLYESSDLVNWRLLGPLAVGNADARVDTDPLWTGTMWECVDFFRLAADGSTAAPDRRSGERHVLIFSAWDEGRTMHPLAATGRYVRDRFEIDGYQRLDLGGRHAYAPQTFIDEQGRRILWSWMQEARDDGAQARAGWSGAMALPRVLRLGLDGIIRQEPAPELTAARSATLEWAREGSTRVAAGTQTELRLSAVVPAGGSLHLELFSTPDRSEVTDVAITRDPDGLLTMALDRSASSLAAGLDTSVHRGGLPGTDAAEEIIVRVFLDRSSIEVFVDGIALTTRVYPTRDDARVIRVSPANGAAVVELTGWRMLPTEQQDRVLTPSAGESQKGR